jgi:DsbC/DsbD-like thiol-disulfide interchange protein
MKINLRLVCALVGALSVSGASAARAQNLHPSDVVQAELLTGWRTSDGTHIAALRLNLAEGWKTYWRVPGNAGIPPQLDWSGSQNVASVQTHWPQPAVFEQNGMYSIGYHDELVLPIEFTPIRADLPMALHADITIGACLDICMPVDLSIQGVLRGAGAPDATIASALRNQPQTARSIGLDNLRCALTPSDRAMRISATMALPNVGANEFVVFEMPDAQLWVTDNSTRREGHALTASAQVSSPTRGPIAINRSAIRVTVFSGDHMVEQIGCPAAD